MKFRWMLVAALVLGVFGALVPACNGGDDDDDSSGDDDSDGGSDWRVLICERIADCSLADELGVATEEDCFDFVDALDGDAFDCTVQTEDCSALAQCFETGDDDDDSGPVTDDTWIDPDTGITWQVKPYKLYVTWDTAVTRCEELELDGRDDWRLPTISELRTLIRGCWKTVPGGECAVTDECTNYDDCWDSNCDCPTQSGPNNGCYGPFELPFECESFWSSTTSASDPNFAWYAFFGSGGVYGNTTDAHAIARCVRE